MPNRNRKQRRGARQNNNYGSSCVSSTAMSRIVRIQGQGILTFTIGGTDLATALNLSPDGLSSQISRFGDLMEAYQLFRFTSVKLRCYAPDAESVTSAIGYSQGDLSVTPGTTNARDIAQLSGAVVFPPAQATVRTFPCTVPQDLVLRRAVLIRDAPNKWWRTQPGTAVEAWEENQGELVWAQTANFDTTLVTHMFYTIELTSPVSPALIPREPQLTPAFLKFMEDRILKSMQGNLVCFGSNQKK